MECGKRMDMVDAWSPISEDSDLRGLGSAQSVSLSCLNRGAYRFFHSTYSLHQNSRADYLLCPLNYV
ncbi:hypothetical protein TNCV_4156301 [Trichonephila clavipes]|nr:hypothetical protein TNCV_4156301 [Trichonephila clavipes]